MDWRVLDKQDGKVLLLKDNSLGSTPFDETGKNVTWESSSVRKWLNGDFLNDNFFKAEQNAILDTTVKNTQILFIIHQPEKTLPINSFY